MFPKRQRKRADTRAEILWKWCCENSGFTARVAANSTKINIDSVRRYLYYWRGLGVAENLEIPERGHQGRPRFRWRISEPREIWPVTTCSKRIPDGKEKEGEATSQDEGSDSTESGGEVHSELREGHPTVPGDDDGGHHGFE